MKHSDNRQFLHWLGVFVFLFLFLSVLIFGKSISQPLQARATDDAFATKAASGGMAEVKLGQLAQDKGSSEAVREFGKRMVVDHTKGGEQLAQAAKADGISLPQEMNAADRRTYDRLAKLSGDAFDRAYMKTMVADHQKDIAEFQSEASDTRHQALQSFASSSLPTLQDHLRHAREVATNLQKK